MKRSIGASRLLGAGGIAAIVFGGMTLLAQTPSGESSSLPDGPAPQKLTFPAQRPTAPASFIGQVTVLEDTPIHVLTNAPINSKRVDENAPLLFTVSEDVTVDGVLAIPRGATVHGAVVKSKHAGVLTGSPELTLKLVSLELGDKTYPIYSSQFKVTGISKTPATEKKAVVGAYAGAIAGGAFSGVSAKDGVQTTTGTGRAASMGAGAAVGAGVGAAVSAATPGPGIWIPSESQIDFSLAAPVTVTPLSAKEAEKLSEGLHKGGPMLYVRGETP